MRRYVANWMNLRLLLAIIQKKYGSRNENGDHLAQLAVSNDLILTNTAFCHPSRRISTWHGTFLNRNTQQNQDYHNQIDYVLCRLVDKQILLNARSYIGPIARTDHSVIVTLPNITPASNRYRNRNYAQYKLIDHPYQPIQPYKLFIEHHGHTSTS